MNGPIDITNDVQIEQINKNEVIEAIFFLNKELLQEDSDQEFKAYFYQGDLSKVCLGLLFLIGESIVHKYTTQGYLYSCTGRQN